MLILMDIPQLFFPSIELYPFQIVFTAIAKVCDINTSAMATSHGLDL